MKTDHKWHRLARRKNPAVIRKRMLADPVVKRLRNNRSWKPVADAALDYFVDGTPCLMPWMESSTWKQIKVVFDEIAGK
jgi:hypothetical protein